MQWGHNTPIILEISSHEEISVVCYPENKSVKGWFRQLYALGFDDPANENRFRAILNFPPDDYRFLSKTWFLADRACDAIWGLYSDILVAGTYFDGMDDDKITEILSKKIHNHEFLAFSPLSRQSLYLPRAAGTDIADARIMGSRFEAIYDEYLNIEGETLSEVLQIYEYGTDASDLTVISGTDICMCTPDDDQSYYLKVYGTKETLNEFKVNIIKSMKDMETEFLVRET